MSASTDERVFEAIDDADWPRRAISPGGDSQEVRHLMTVRDLADELDLSEGTVRLSVRRLADAGRIYVYHLRDIDAQTRRLYVTTTPDTPTLADILLGATR